MDIKISRDYAHPDKQIENDSDFSHDIEADREELAALRGALMRDRKGDEDYIPSSDTSSVSDDSHTSSVSTHISDIFKDPPMCNNTRDALHYYRGPTKCIDRYGNSAICGWIMPNKESCNWSIDHHPPATICSRLRHDVEADTLTRYGRCFKCKCFANLHTRQTREDRQAALSNEHTSFSSTHATYPSGGGNKAGGGSAPHFPSHAHTSDRNAQPFTTPSPSHVPPAQPSDGQVPCSRTREFFIVSSRGTFPDSNPHYRCDQCSHFASQHALAKLCQLSQQKASNVPSGALTPFAFACQALGRCIFCLKLISEHSLDSNVHSTSTTITSSRHSTPPNNPPSSSSSSGSSSSSDDDSATPSSSLSSHSKHKHKRKHKSKHKRKHSFNNATFHLKHSMSDFKPYDQTTSLRRYLIDFDELCVPRRIPKDYRLQYMYELLPLPHMRDYIKKIKEQKLTWKQQKLKLIAHFDSPELYAQHRQKWNSLHQEATESLNNYTSRFTSLARELGLSLDEKATIDKYVHSLDSALQSIMALKRNFVSGNLVGSCNEMLHFDTFEDAHQAATSADRARFIPSFPSTPVSSHTSSSTTLTTISNPSTSSTTTTSSTMPPPPPRSRTRPRSEEQSNYDNKRPRSRCFACNEYGHISTECPQRNMLQAQTATLLSSPFFTSPPQMQAMMTMPQLYPQAPPNFGPPPSSVPMPMLPPTPPHSPSAISTSGTLMTQRRGFPDVPPLSPAPISTLSTTTHPQSTMICTACGKPNHTADRCRSKQQCDYCGRLGHISRTCRMRMNGQLPSRVKPETNTASSLASGANSVPLAQSHISNASINSSANQASSHPASSVSHISSSPPTSSSLPQSTSSSLSSSTNTQPQPFYLTIQNGQPMICQPTAPRTNAIQVTDFVEGHQLARQSKVFCMHPSHPELALTTLLDSGSTHTCISPNAVLQLGLSQQIVPPKGPVTEVTLADGKTKVKRIGTLTLKLHVFFLGAEREPAHLHLTCEIMPLHIDLLFGVDTLSVLFPNDNLTQFFIPPSFLSSLPIPLTVEYEFDPQIHTHPVLRVCPEGHLSKHTPEKHTNMEAIVAALDLIDELAAKRLLNLKKQEEVTADILRNIQEAADTYHEARTQLQDENQDP